MKKDEVLAKIKAEKVVALIRADSSDGLLDCARALAAGGLTSIELTMTTPGAIEMIRLACRELPSFIFGLGTVLDAKTAREGIEAGAKFIVTPGFRPDVIAHCRSVNVPILSGSHRPELLEYLANLPAGFGHFWTLGADRPERHRGKGGAPRRCGA